MMHGPINISIVRSFLKVIFNKITEYKKEREREREREIIVSYDRRGTFIPKHSLHCQLSYNLRSTPYTVVKIFPVKIP